MFEIRDDEVLALGERYALQLPRDPLAGRSGEMLGQGLGASLEFQDYREYAPGDDLRHVDWAAFARTDALLVRQYREEISPRIEIILDASVSMGFLPEKEKFVRKLASFFLDQGARLSRESVLWRIGDRIEQARGQEQGRLFARPFDGRKNPETLLLQEPPPFKRRSIRIVISDFLFPHLPDRLLASLGRGAAALHLLQPLALEEEMPTGEGPARLIDNEGGEVLETLLGETAVARYRQRLARLIDGLKQTARRWRATFVTAPARKGLTRLFREELLPAGLLRVD